MNTATLFSSATDEWETPIDFFNRLDDEFRFVLDVAASSQNKKCELYLGLDHHYQEWRDGLSTSWRAICGAGSCWMNPPYSRGLQAKFIAKASVERRNGVLTVALLPARTDTQAFHGCIWDAEKHQPKEGVEIRFIKGRLKFGGASNSAPFPSMVVIFRP